ncbi:MAG TPA: hypothetical protein PLH00_05985 [Bacteroidaceae bacterium]|nr:hypothetical protein [Bacteroidaceae bacterium]
MSFADKNGTDIAEVSDSFDFYLLNFFADIGIHFRFLHENSPERLGHKNEKTTFDCYFRADFGNHKRL